LGFTFKPLWKLLIDKDMTKDQFRKQIDISSSTLAKMRKNENISMDVLDKICKHFNCSLNDIMEHIPDPENK
jgi:putative transcriptional regulator